MLPTLARVQLRTCAVASTKLGYRVGADKWRNTPRCFVKDTGNSLIVSTIRPVAMAGTRGSPSSLHRASVRSSVAKKEPSETSDDSSKTLLDDQIQVTNTLESKGPSAVVTGAVVAVPLVLLLVWVAQQGGLGTAVENVQEFIANAGSAGPVYFMLVYIIATVAFLPASALTLAAGYLYGPGLGTAIVSVSSTAAASAAFLISRYLAKPWVEEKLAGYPRVLSFQDAIEEEGARAVFLLRLSPLIPFNLSNYFYGLTRVPFGPYVLASWSGMLPGTFAYVYLGGGARATIEAVGDVSEDGSGFPVVKLGLYAIGAVATLVATARISKSATQALERSNRNPSALAQEDGDK
mmetsp:Transcript_25027/g.47304  ORF Transcript_25027/g.47304 Transcript_25027/m.47304 type:complete len:350 (-) Transcript_25027:260-1309(-)